jgi:hypothetical protein
MIAGFADRVTSMILADVDAGVLVRRPASFGDAHDITDANMYLEQAGVPAGDDTDAGLDYGMAVQADVGWAVSRRLGYHAPCAVCGGTERY